MGSPRPGDRVVVRSLGEILSTLDPSGALEGLPFLPEMTSYCGRELAVRRRVDKLIQEGVGSSMRRIRNVVLLEGAVCDGRDHGDCQRACFPLWKTAWLRPADERSPRSLPADPAGSSPDGAPGERDAAVADLPRKTCQVTELLKATKPLPLWHPLRHYWDLSSRTYSPRDYLAYIARGIYKRSLKKVIGRLARRTSKPRPQAPPEPLDLKPGDVVEVRSRSEIRATLDADGRHKGLYFMPAMWSLCGRRLRVLQRVDRMMSEKTGEMRSLARTVILEGVTCDGKAHGGCQRGCLVFWKDAWLKRGDEAPA